MRAFTANLVVGLFFLALRAPAAVAGYEQEILADKPFVYFRFEETGGTLAADSSGNGHDAEYVDGVDLQQPSADVGLGNAALFDGFSGYVQLPNLDFESDQVTIETWVNLELLAGGCCTSVFSPDGWDAGWVHYNIRENQNIEFALNSGGPNNLTVIGSLDGGGGLGDVDLVYVPEPSAVLLFTLGVVGLLAGRRRLR